VPRPNLPRSMQSEENLAHRIAYERERRRWTYEGTAKRLTEAGCPTQGSAIYKIEKGNPRRRISVDELVGFAKVFDVETSDLLIPLELIAEQEVLRLMAELEDKFRVLYVSTEGYNGAVEHIVQLANTIDKEHAQRILGVLYRRLYSMAAQVKKLNEKNDAEIFNMVLKFKAAMEASWPPGFSAKEAFGESPPGLGLLLD
jgi:transcriptional regulator with XRE-family HTH domain